MIRMLIAVAVGLAVVWAIFVVCLLIARPKGMLKEALRLLPDTIRLLRRLASDQAPSRSVRWRL